KKPQITASDIASNLLLPARFVVLFLGSSTTYSKWPVKKFAQIARYLNFELGLEIVICGGPNDVNNANEFKTEYQNPYLDFVGKTSLAELVVILSRARLLVSNETSAPHFAVAMDIPTVVIYNGNHFGRFTPYPLDMTSKYAVVCHPSIEQNFEAYKLLSNKCGYSSTLDINKIEVQQVIDEINKVYSNNS
ncbi:MAG: glycosyltransferase family 9 protein, partial [Sphingomonadales bacterium]|nr:glycosyltransferase family 9 protein [Sphingomonadales bacterium]